MELNQVKNYITARMYFQQNLAKLNQEELGSLLLVVGKVRYTSMFGDPLDDYDNLVIDIECQIEKLQNPDTVIPAKKQKKVGDISFIYNSNTTKQEQINETDDDDFCNASFVTRSDFLLTIINHDKILNSTLLKDIEKEAIVQCLTALCGNRTKTAKVLGISIRTLRNKLNEYRLENANFTI